MIKDTTYYIKFIVALTFFLILLLLLINLVKHPLKQRWINKNMAQKEGFSISPGKYPCSVDNPLLQDSYKLLDLPGISTFNSRNSYETYPVFSASSPQINNIRKWTNPDNGKCSPLDICKGIYKDTVQKIKTQLNVPGWNNRVNYYEKL